MICPKPLRLGSARMSEQITANQLAHDSDSAVIERCKKGDLQAFRTLVERHQRAVYAVVSRILMNPEDIEDTVQETFLQGYRSIASFRGDSSFGTWICRIAIHAAFKHSKDLGKHLAFSLDDDEMATDAILRSSEPGPEELLQQSEREKAIRKAVMALPEKHRLVIALHYFDGLSCQEIAEYVGCSVGTIWSRLHYASKKLKEDLSWLIE